MTEPAESAEAHAAERTQEAFVAEPATDETSLSEDFKNTVNILQDVGLTEPTDVKELDGQQRDGQTVGAHAAHSSSTGPKDWKAGSRCRAVFSEDGLVYPAVVLWVEGRRCRIRFDTYNNEEDQDVGNLLNPDELHGPSRIATKHSTWKPSLASSKSDRRRRREEGHAERGGDHHQNSSWQLSGESSEISKVEKEAEEKNRGRHLRDEAEKSSNHSFCLLPPYPPPQSGDTLSFIPPPPVSMFGGKESSGSGSLDTTSNMLMLWYLCGFHTGTYMAQQLFKSTSKD